MPTKEKQNKGKVFCHLPMSFFVISKYKVLLRGNLPRSRQLTEQKVKLTQFSSLNKN